MFIRRSFLLAFGEEIRIGVSVGVVYSSFFIPTLRLNSSGILFPPFLLSSFPSLFLVWLSQVALFLASVGLQNSDFVVGVNRLTGLSWKMGVAAFGIVLITVLLTHFSVGSSGSDSGKCCTCCSRTVRRTFGRLRLKILFLRSAIFSFFLRLDCIVSIELNLRFLQ